MKKILLRSVGLLILVYLLGWVVDLPQVGAVLLHFNRWMLLSILPFYISLWTLRTLRWQLLLQGEEIDLPFGDVMVLAASGFFIGSMTPGRVGEFAKVNFLMNAGYSFRGAFLSSLWERIFDMAALFFYVVFAVIVCWKAAPNTMIFTLCAGGGGCIGLSAAYAFRRRIKAMILRIIPESIAGSVDEKLSILSRSIRTLQGRRFWIVMGFSLAMWGLNHCMIFLLFRGAGYEISILFSFAFSTIGSLAALVPVSIYGVGVRESMMIGMFSLVGYDPSIAKTAGFVFGMMFVLLFICHTLWGLLCWLSPAMEKYFSRKSVPQV